MTEPDSASQPDAEEERLLWILEASDAGPYLLMPHSRFREMRAILKRRPDLAVKYHYDPSTLTDATADK